MTPSDGAAKRCRTPLDASTVARLVAVTYHSRMKPQIVLDTNVLVAASRSRRGAAFRLVSLLPAASFEINLSVPLVYEYEILPQQLHGMELTTMILPTSLTTSVRLYDRQSP